MAGASATFFWLFSSLLCFCSHGRGPTSPGRNISNATATDELALLSFKSVLDSHGSDLDSWNTSSHFCSWPGVSCGHRHPERVVALSMRAANLSGRISPSLGNLSFLRELDLRDNHLVGEIPPELARLGRLQLLNLSTNSLEGVIPPAMEGCTNLEALVLSKNQLQGEIPEGLGTMENLYVLDLQENRLSGEIPEPLANLSSSIGFLFLYSNMLTGAIPPALGNLSGLLHLDVMDNMLSGAIPWSLGMLASLSWLSLANNSLSGEIPAPIWNISSLWGINIQENNLTGTIPATAFSKLSELLTLSMDNNGFHGHLPASLANASQLRLVQLGPNSFSGVIPPEIGYLRNVESMLLSNTLLGAKEPGDWEFMRALENCSQLLTLDLTNCKFSGILPRSVSNLSTSLQTLYLPYNTISGTLPEDIGNLVSLQSLVVDSNTFTGTLPSSIGNLNSLRLLSASYNNFTGSIPLSVGNLTELNILNIKANAFSDIVPSTLGNLTKLLELHLGRNYFTGPIPAALFRIPTLSIILDLSHNSFEGPIPEEIGNLINLVEFHAESNNFTGNIPDRLGECQLLRYLYLQNNFLSGNVPSLFGQLKGLQFLDLSSNNLSGQIPGFFGNFSMLYYINLSFNSFAGELPTFGAFANVSAISIEGNNKLCGGISDLHLPPCTSLAPAKRKHKFLVIPIVTSLVMITVMLPLLCILLTWYKKRKPKIPSTTPMQGRPLISYSQLVRATNDFSETNFLGSGSFGSVYKGELNDAEGESTNLVAVKVLRLQNPMALKSFIAECEALRNMRHRNLLKIITVCSSIDTKGNDFKAIVYDFMPNGCLEEWLHPNTNLQEQRYLNLLERVTILLDVAYALDYLHCHGPEPVVHCDLKSSNVLLDADMVAHVGDFGLAKILVERSSSAEQPTSSMGFRGTIGYAAPEYGAGNTASTHGDIYSYGILVLETVTGKRPTDSGFVQGLSLREYVEGALHNTVMDAVDIRLATDLENRLHTMGDCSYRTIVLLLRLECPALRNHHGAECQQEVSSKSCMASKILSKQKAENEDRSKTCCQSNHLVKSVPCMAHSCNQEDICVSSTIVCVCVN